MQTLTEATFTAQDEATVRGMCDSAARYIKAGDWSSWAGQSSENGVLQPPAIEHLEFADATTLSNTVDVIVRPIADRITQAAKDSVGTNGGPKGNWKAPPGQEVYVMGVPQQHLAVDNQIHQ